VLLGGGYPEGSVGIIARVSTLIAVWAAVVVASRSNQDLAGVLDGGHLIPEHLRTFRG